MNKKVKKQLILATTLLFAGLITLLVVMAYANWDFKLFNTVDFVTNTYEQSDDFDSISINTSTADIIFAQSNDGKCRVVCYEIEKSLHTVSVEEGVLTINNIEEREWFEHIGLMVGTPTITIYLPKTEYKNLVIDEATGDIELTKEIKFESLDIASKTGDICLENITANSINITSSTGDVDVKDVKCNDIIRIKVSTGDVKFVDVSCENFSTTGSTGNVELKNFLVTEKMDINRSTGNIKLNGSDANDIYIKTSTGSIKGSILSAKQFYANSSTGDVDVPGTDEGGRCDLITSTGDIRISIKN